MATAVHGRVSRFLRWPFRVLGYDKDLTGQSPLPEKRRKRRHRKTDARERVPTDVLSAICHCDCIQASGENAPNWIELGRLRENNKVPERGDYSRRDQIAIDLNF